MTPGDRSNFYKYLSAFFLEEWKEKLSQNQLERWFDGLSVASFDRIQKAFELYLRDGSAGRFPPKEGQITAILRTIPFDVNAKRCDWPGCPKTGDNRFSENYWYCRKHQDEMHFRYFPDSATAFAVSNEKKTGEEINESGLTGREYYKQTNPSLFEHITQKRQVDRAKENVTRAMREFLGVQMPEDERKKIIGDMRVEIRNAQAGNYDRHVSNG